MHHAHAAATAASRCFEHHRISDAGRRLEAFLGALQYPFRSRQDGNPAFRHRGARALLQSHGSGYVGFRPDELDFRRLTHFGEIRILTQETVAGMNGIDVGDFSGADYRRNIEIAARAFGGTNADGLIGESHVQAVAIGFRVYSHGLDAQVLAGADDANGDFASIGDQDFLKHINRDTSA